MDIIYKMQLTSTYFTILFQFSNEPQPRVNGAKNKSHLQRTKAMSKRSRTNKKQHEVDKNISTSLWAWCAFVGYQWTKLIMNISNWNKNAQQCCLDEIITIFFSLASGSNS